MSNQSQIANKSEKNKINQSTYHHDKYKHLIDKSCPDKFNNKVHIHVYDGHLLWCTLNQTDLETNSNKYYIMQLLKHDVMNSYFLINRSGRVGYENKKDFKCFLNEEKAIDEFRKTFFEKTGYLWSDRFDISKKDGKYDYVDMEIDKDIDTNQIKENKSPSTPMDPKVEAFINLIFDLKMFEETMRKFKIDTDKAPLGKISTSQINKAYAVLTSIQTLIQSNVVASDKQYVKLSSDFYTFIPTSHGNQKLPAITTESQFKEKFELLNILGEMEVLGNIMSKISLDSSKIWQQYQSLNAEIQALNDQKMISNIERYMKQSKGSTHSHNLSIKQIYEINRQGETERFEKVKSYGNRQLLWHGSRLSNFVGILSKGLRIAPPEAPSTGYMFGKGVYFANSVTKSAQYMHAENGTGVILLCEVALGSPYQCKKSEYVTKLPDGHHSTWGLGASTPDLKETVVLNDGLIVPLGNLVPSDRSGLTLRYDEFIVYDVAQIKIRYAIILNVK